METQRQIRFGELIRTLLSDCLLKEDFFDSDINISSITISFVKMSKDLKIANIYFMPLGGKNKIEIPKKRTKPNNKWISISKARANNLDNINVEIPIGLLTCVTGVSGSGKSSLINNVLYSSIVNKLLENNEVFV